MNRFNKKYLLSGSRDTLLRVLSLALFLAGVPTSLEAFTYRTHENLPEDTMLFMESHGTNQQRWVADYLKAKAGGRYTGTCRDKSDLADEMHEGTVQTECGAIGIARVGGINPDYFRDTFWDDFSDFGWNFPNPFLKNNFTSWFHFINLLKTNELGYTLKTDNNNDYDGYAYNQTYGFDQVGIDYSVATMMNNAQMTIDLPACTDPECGEMYSIVPNGNPATDYKQNSSTTPIGTPSGATKIDSSNGTNYNCFSDTAFNDCPDEAGEIGGYYQEANKYPGNGSYFTGDQDWVIYEPADNVATFYYHEMFLEGGASRNNSLDTGSLAGRYYAIPGNDLIYLMVTTHWIGDMNQQSHIWATIGYNHGEYEEWTDERYGFRTAGGSDSTKNFENYTEARAYMRHRQNRYHSAGQISTLEEMFMEQAFLTYHIRLRPGYDTLTSTTDDTRKKAATWAVNNSIALMSLMFEKGVLELRAHK